jgi:alkylation response protein AidB-like acyl-CoA dehydrogenase
MDPTRPAWDVTLDNCPAELLGGVGDGDLAWAEFDLLGGFLTAAEAAGGARECLDRAVSYAKERVQFGRPIGQFQAIKHQCADMLVQCEGATLAVQAAADTLADWTADGALLSGGPTGPLDSPRVTVSVAKAYASEAFYRCAATSLHVHGGRGFLWEDDAHLYFRRAITGALQFGDAARHREIIASALAASAATVGAA